MSRTVSEAVKLLRKTRGSRALAGGHSLLPMMKLRLAGPSALIDLGGISALRGIKKAGAKIIIFGAVKKDDGTLEANRVNVGRDGITPPM